LFGVASGVGLMVKITLMFLAFSFVTGLLLTKNRAFFKTKYLWYGAAIALLIFSPYIVWQIQQGGLILEYWGNYAAFKAFRASPLELIIMEIIMMNPVALPLWLGGLYYLLLNKTGRKYAVLGHMLWIYLVLAIVMAFKFYILSGSFLAVVSAGAIWVEKWLTSKKAMRWRNTYAAAVFLAGLLLMPMAVPVLPIETYIAIDRLLFAPMTGSIQVENIETEELLQHFSDRFGWEEVVAAVSDAYHSLPEEEQKNYAIFAINYSFAGAINIYGEKYGLPEAISGHLSHYVWGPGDYDLNTAILVGFPGDAEEPLRDIMYEYVESAATVNTKYAQRKDVGVFICEGLKVDKDEFWESFKSLD